MKKTQDQINNIQVAGNIISQIVSLLPDFLHEGMSTYDIDKYIHELIIKEGGTPSFLGYHGYSASTCISINEEIIHGCPNKQKKISMGDVISIDIGVTYQGGIADSAYTFYLGDSPPEKIKHLMDVTQTALLAGIDAVKPKNHISDISKAIQKVAKQGSLGIVKKYCGHGVGIELHEAPEIPNFHPSYGNNARLHTGMVIAIEPMLTLGSGEIVLLKDNFTVASKDKSIAAHFEHTVLVTEKGYQILTK